MESKIKNAKKILDVLKTSEILSIGEHKIKKITRDNIDIYITFLPAERDGGDIYGVVDIDDKHTGVFIGDIAGHDLASTITATPVMKFIDQNYELMLTLDEFVKKMSAKLYNKLDNLKRFFTFACVVLNNENSTLTYCNAGHPPLIILRDAEEKFIYLKSGSLPIGFSENINSKQLYNLFLPGDILIMYTDGILSARNKNKIEFGEKRFREIISASKTTPRHISANVLEALEKFGVLENDDRTLITIIKK